MVATLTSAFKGGLTSAMAVRGSFAVYKYVMPLGFARPFPTNAPFGGIKLPVLLYPRKQLLSFSVTLSRSLSALSFSQNIPVLYIIRMNLF